MVENNYFGGTVQQHNRGNADMFIKKRTKPKMQEYAGKEKVNMSTIISEDSNKPLTNYNSQIKRHNFTSKH